MGLQLLSDLGPDSESEVYEAAMARHEARMSFAWQTAFRQGGYAKQPQGDAVAVARAMRDKWKPYFTACAEQHS